MTELNGEFELLGRRRNREGKAACLLWNGQKREAL